MRNPSKLTSYILTNTTAATFSEEAAYSPAELQFPFFSMRYLGSNYATSPENTLKLTLIKLVANPSLSCV